VGSTLAKGGSLTGFADIFESKLLVQPGTTSINTARYVEFTITPDETVEEWTPTSITWTQACRTSGTSSAQIRTSDDAYAAAVGTTQTQSATPASKTISLSGLGVQTGALTVRLLVAAPTSPNGVFISGLSVAGDYVPAGGVDQNVEPAGIATAEAFGSPVLVIVQPVDLSPEGIASGEAFGTPVIEHGAPVPVVSYPAGQDVADFLGIPDDARLVAVAEVHVGVITHFARVYTRGNGFYVDGVVPELASVVLAATGRLVANPEQIDITVGTVRRAGSFKGWSLAEQRVLNEYRGVSL
jgi:hypothetical protein